MKKIEEMTKEEILSLNDEDINRMVDYECAEQGIPLLSSPAKPKELDVEGMKDVTIYELNDMHFRDKAKAEAIQKAISGCELVNIRYCSGPSYHKKDGGNVESTPTIKTMKIFSEDKWNKVRDEINKYATAMGEYNKDKKKYDDSISSRNDIAKDIWYVYNQAIHEQAMINRYVGEFNKYLELAENNTEIALRFLLKAYPEIEEKYPDVLTIVNGDGQKQDS